MRSHAKAPFAGSVWIAGATALILGLAFLAVSSSPAFAAVGHSVVRTLSTGPSTDPGAVATDSAGNVYVVEQGVKRIEKFDPAGNSVDFTASAQYLDGNRIIGSPAGPFPYFNARVGIAVDRSGGPDDGYIYVAEQRLGNAEVYVYAASGKYLGRLGHDPGYCAIAVDQADGSVYVASPESVDRFAAPSGDPASALPNGRLHAGACAIAADGGDIVVNHAVVVDTSQGNNLTVGEDLDRYDASQFGSPSPSPTLLESFAPAQLRILAVDSGNGDIYLGPDHQISKRDAAGVQQGEPFGDLGGGPSGLAVDGSGNALATDAGGGIFVYAPNEVQLPTGSTGGSSSVGPDSASVEGAVDPDGAGDITGCEFRYGEDTGYSDGFVPCAPSGPISSPTSVSANLTGLVSGTTYHYRLFLINANGTQASTGDKTFSTPAATESVFTGGPSEVTRQSADLNGFFSGDGQDVHYFFEWGRTNAYGHTTPVPPGGDAGTEVGFQSVAPIQISGLEPNTAYHYRLVVSTASGITRGQDESFTTPEAVANLSADPATAITGSSAVLHGSFDGDETFETHYFFEWGPTSRYGNKTPAPPGTAVPAGSGRIELPAVQVEGLKEGIVYHYRVVASNATGTSVSGDASFRTAEAPAIGPVKSRDLQASSAELVGQINPRFGNTTYHFDWGPSATYGQQSPTGGASAGSDNAPVSVSTRLTGLTPGVTYHFRLVATNQYGTTVSTDQTFGFYPPNCPNSQIRQETRSDALPDCRAYELVSPTYAQGTVIYPGNGPVAPLATSPSRLAYSGATGLFPEETGEPSNVTSDLYVSTRTDRGWTQRYVGRPATETVMMGGPPRNIEEYFFSSQLGNSRTMLGTQATANLDRIASYDRGFTEQVPREQLGERDTASNAPYVWNTMTGGLIARFPSNLNQVPKGEKFVGKPGFSADFSHFVFESNIPFAAGGIDVPRTIACCPFIPPAKDPEWEQWPALQPSSIYDNDVQTGAVDLISLKADSTAFVGYVLNVSEDGSHILMSESNPDQRLYIMPQYRHQIRDIPGPLYLRADHHTYEIASGHRIAYVGSTDDGATVFLRSDDALTPADHDSSSDLYAWHQNDEKLTLLTAGESGDAGNTDDCGGITWNGGGCNVEAIDFLRYASITTGPDQETFSGFLAAEGGNGYSDSAIASESGEIFFISPEQLIAGKGEFGQANLYLSRGGQLRYVTTMAPQPTCTQGGAGRSCSTGPVARMQVTPDGSHMAFVTNANVTGYNSAGRTEMYTYDPESGRVICASCRPDGQTPISDVFASQNGLFQSYDGRVFFSTNDSLVPRDTNGVQDIYEYTEGRPQLISAGLGAALEGFGGFLGSFTAPGLVSVSANGTDVYFATLDVLVTQDHNGQQLKIYDARTGGGFPAEVTPAKCEAADECHGTGASPPALPPDRTSAAVGKAKAKAHKAKKHKKRAHKKKHKRAAKKSKTPKTGKQGRKNRG